MPVPAPPARALLPLRAALDTDVLFSAPLRDFLLRSAYVGQLYRPHWSEGTLRELQAVLMRERRLSQAQVDHVTEQMRIAFPDATVQGTSLLPHCLTNDVKDRHVLAAAVMAHAGIVVTNDGDDFPACALAPFHIEAMGPDPFLAHLYRRRPGVLVEVLAAQASSLRNPPMRIGDILDRLERHAPQFVAQAQTSITGVGPP
jgi:predicted nucleic acid-binding protein